MYRKLAIRITDCFINKDIILEQKKAIYYYGFELLISSIIYFLIFLLISLVTKSLIASFFFWLGLFLIRKTAGGHHSNSYKKCHLLFAANHTFFVILLKTIPTPYYFYVNTSILILSILSILIFAPVDHKNKPFIKTEYKRFKLFSKIYCIILLLIGVFSIINIIPPSSYFFGFSFGSLSATISLLFAKIIRFKERKKNHEKNH